MKLFTKSMEPNTTLGVAERVAYMSGNIGIALINTIVATFLMFFYTDVMMLNAGIIGTILMVSRLFDGVTDIIMGMIVDRTHSKYGKARVWVIRTCIPYAISGLLLVCVPGGMTELVQYIYVFITYNICNSVFLTALYVPYNAMTCNITSNPYEREVLGIFVLFGATFGTLAVQSTVDAATKALGGDQRAWQIVVGIYAICGLILHLICFFGTKERCGSTSEKVKIHAKEEMRSLLKSILGLIKPLSGSVTLGDYLEIGYFEQEMDQSVTTTCIEEIWNEFPAFSQYEVRSALAKCGLTTKHIESQVRVLSGGEQAKVRLCKLINRETNILLLDEPTNHLDVDAKDELKRALKEYKGSILMVCHEPDFYDGLATDVWDCSKWTTRL